MRFPVGTGESLGQGSSSPGPDLNPRPPGLRNRNAVQSAATLGPIVIIITSNGDNYIFYSKK
jgi:hypothetical protein